MLSDAFGRVINYLRVSVTDRCNLRCIYCLPVKDFRFLPHSSVLAYEEYLRIITLAAPLGLSKVRLTGGEPLARRGFEDFLGRVVDSAPKLDIRLTTNGTLLAGRARRLAELGLKVVNISLDSLRPATYQRVTGQDLFAQARRAVDECLEAGLKVKINAVAMKGVNDAELPAFVELARTHPVDVRFIEFMPIGDNTAWKASLVWPAADILEKLGRLAELIPELPGAASRGPAQLWRMADGQGRLGVISGISGHYCASCNRLRLTCDGRLRPCLYSDVEYRLRPLLRHPRVSDERLLDVLRRALARKPMGYKLLEERDRRSVCAKPMASIGG